MQVCLLKESRCIKLHQQNYLLQRNVTSSVMLRLISLCGGKEINTIFSYVLLSARAVGNRMSQGEGQFRRETPLSL